MNNTTAMNETNATTPAMDQFWNAIDSGLFQEGYKFIQNKVTEFVISCDLVPVDTYFLLLVIMVCAVIVLVLLSRGANMVNSSTKWIVYVVITVFILIGIKVNFG